MRRIIVGVKRVVDYNVRIRVKPDNSGVITDGVKMSINPFDEIALEEALRIKERGLADEVLAVSVGPSDTQQQLRTALAMGADRAVLVQTDAVVPPLSVARIFHKLIEKEQPFLVLVGKQAIDDDNGQTAQMLAGIWDRPQAVSCSKIAIADGKATVTREVDAGLEVLEVDLPAVLSVDLRLNEPRYVKLPDIMKAKKKPLDTLALADLGVTETQNVRHGQGRAAAAAPEGRDGQGRRRTRRCAQEEGVGVMSTILVVAEHDGAKLNSSTLKCVSCATKVAGAAVDILVLATDSAAVAAQASAIAGVGKVLAVDNPANAEALAAVLAPQVARLAADYTHVFGPSTTFGKDLMPRVAALLGVGQVSDVMAVEGPHRFRRPVYAGNALLTLDVPAVDKVVATVRVASFEAAATGGSAAIAKVDPGVALPTHTRFVSRSAASTGRPDLQSASRVVAGGRALGSADGFKLIYSLADKLGAAVGASRAAVDAGYAPNDLQVGQTGKIIAPELYIGIGISGAIQHMTGIKDARTIVAINKDGEAPIFEAADIGLVGDLFAIVPELEKQLN